MKACFLDIETAPEPEEVLAKVKPEFKAAANLRDPEKIKASIAEKEREWRDQLALDAVTARVLCVGVIDHDAQFRVFDGEERNVLETTWAWVREYLGNGTKVVGFNCFAFDWPFLVRRSLKLGVRPYGFLRSKYWHSDLVDVMDLWCCGNRDQRISLDTLAKFIGLPGKLGSGADFAALWASDRKAALAYLQRDVELVRDIYQRMCAE